MKRIALLLTATFFVALTIGAVPPQNMEASQVIALLKKGQAVQFTDKIIAGDLDFSQSSKPFMVGEDEQQCEICPNIYFNRCIFTGTVKSGDKAAAVFRNNLIFTSCDFRQDVNFSNSIVFGMIKFDKSIFHENAVFDEMMVWAKDSYFSNVTVEKACTMVNTTFAGNFHCKKTSFAGNNPLQTITIHGSSDIGDLTYSIAMLPDEVKKIREDMAILASKAPNFDAVDSDEETLIYNGNKYPILGYERDGSKGDAIAYLPKAILIDMGIPTDERISSSLDCSVTVTSGKYKGTRTGWYMVAWADLSRVNLYLDVKWAKKSK